MVKSEYLNKKKDKHIFLDLDQTCISAEASNEFDHDKEKEKARKFTFHDMDGYYVVFERPGLQKFLDYLFTEYNVSVWTAASKDYAAFIIEHVILANKSNRKLEWSFFSYHCDLSKEKKGGSKSLEMLWDEFKLDGLTDENT